MPSFLFSFKRLSFSFPFLQIYCNFSMRDKYPVDMVLSVDPCGLRIAMSHTPLRVNPLLVEEKRREGPYLVERWPLVFR